MSISMDTLRVAARTDDQRLHMQGADQLAADGRRPGLFDFAARREISAANRATAEQIKQTLREHYGRARAESLFARHIGGQGGDISAAKLRALVAEGDRQIADKSGVISAAMRSRIEGLPNIQGGAEPAGRRAADKVMTALVRANEVLSQEPLNQPEISQTLEDLRAEIGDVDRRLTELGGLPPELSAFSNQAVADLTALRGQLVRQENLLLDRLASCPTTNANVGHALGLMYDAAILTVSDLMTRATSPADQARLRDLKISLEERKEAAANAGAAPTAKADAARLKSLEKTPGQLTKLIDETASRMRFSEGGGTRKYSAKELGKLVHLAHCEMLNRGPWTTVSRSVDIKMGGGQTTFTSELHPATTLSPTLQAAYGGRGVSCHSTTEARHTVNLAQTELRVPGQAEPVFKALRHGVHCAYGIADPQARQAANDARVNELLVAAVSADPALLNRALAGEAVYLPITSVSLLTPDGWRSGSDDNETMYLREQNEAWIRASHGQRQLTVIGPDGQPHQVRVQPQVIAFNFGVNAGAQGSVLQHIAGGWGISTPKNYEAMLAMLGSLSPNAPIGGAVSAFLAGPAPEAQKAQVRELVAQVRQLWNTGTYRDSGQNPYLLPARLLVLANLTGQTPAFNCKSGKDRTGQLDVEAKTLAAQMSMLGRVPTLDESRSAEYKLVREQIAINGGNYEIQRMNTGLAGFKTKGVSGLDAVYRDEGARRTALGLSKYVHS